MRWAFALPLLLVVACEPSTTGDDQVRPRRPPTSSTDGGDADASVATTVPHEPSAALARCAEAQREPRSIVDAVAHLGELPLPADGPCYVAALPRPLSVVATLGVTSAQPAGGRMSPRLFFLLPKLAISAVPEGNGSKVLEFGEWVTPDRTLKGEIGLPITEALPQDAAFKHVLDGEGTICGVCHRLEEPHPTIPSAFISAAFKPEPGTFVKLTELAVMHDTCARDKDASARCAMFHALFDFGEVEQGEFTKDVGTFFGP